MAAIQQCDLIVDFPSAQQMEVPAPSRKSVRFSETSMMKYMRYPTKEENKAKWYDKETEDGFKRRRWQDVARYSAVLMQDPEDDEDEDAKKNKLINCVGLDHLLARDIVQKAQEVVMARQKHRNVVLNVQELQRRHDIYIPEDLARMASASSRSARERACRIAFIMGSL